MILFTCDIDWAPEEIIADTLALFEKYRVKCTFFATHKSVVVLKYDRSLFEIGLHPNFNPLLDGSGTKLTDAAKVLKQLSSIYPKAKGVRSHSIVQGTTIIKEFFKQGLLYDVNLLLPYQSNIKPFKLWDGFIRVPYNWEDDTHWLYGHPFSQTNLDLKASLNILNFHPIHIFLNTENQERYDRAKKFYQDPKRLKQYINTSKPGTRDLLVSLLKWSQKRKIQPETISGFLKI